MNGLSVVIFLFFLIILSSYLNLSGYFNGIRFWYERGKLDGMGKTEVKAEKECLFKILVSLSLCLFLVGGFFYYLGWTQSKKEYDLGLKVGESDLRFNELMSSQENLS